MSEKRTAKDFAKSGYVVRPATNGGFVVELGAMAPSHSYFPEMASFTNSQDLIAFLSKGHADYDKELMA